MYLAGEQPFEHYQTSVREATQDLITSKSEEIVGRFYHRLMLNPVAVDILGQEKISSRFKQSVADWLATTFDHMAISADHEAFIHHQANIGRMLSHSTCNQVVVNYGRLVLTRIIEDEIEESHSTEEALLLSRYAVEMIQYAADLFTESYRYEVIEMIHHQKVSSMFIRASKSLLN